MEKDKYTIQGLDEYIRQSEPQQSERGEAWRVAIGLQQVDGLTPSSYLIDTARQHIDGEITITEANRLIDSYYKSAASRHEIDYEDGFDSSKSKKLRFSLCENVCYHRKYILNISKIEQESNL